jgi:outer membrane protein
MRFEVLLGFCAVGAISGLAAPALAAPLSLDEAVATALARSKTVLGASENARAAAARVGQALAPWLPQLSSVSLVRGDYSYQTGLQAMEGQTTAPGSGSMRYSSQLQLGQMLYDFGRTSGRIAAASAGARAAEADADTTRAQAALQAATGFYSVLQAEALRDVSQRNVEQQRQRLQQAESFYHIGTRPEIDVLIARTAVKSAELELVKAQNNIWVARAQLLETLGLDSQDWPVWLKRPLAAPDSRALGIETADLFEAPERAAESLLEEALSRRPEYRAQRQRVEQARQQLSAIRADYLPQLGLSGSASLAGNLVSSSSGNVGGITVGGTVLQASAGQSPTLALSGVLTLSWPILSGLSTVYQVRESRAQLAAAEASLEALRLSMRSQLYIALSQLGTARRSLEAAQALSEQAGKQRDMARGRYKAGVGNAIELGDAEVAALQAEAQRVQAESALGLARAAVRWQLGLLVPLSG